MTRDEAVVALVQAIPGSSPQDIEAFLNCSDDERALIIQSLKDAGTMPDPSAWDRILSVLKACVDVANLVIPIEGAISGIYGVVHPS